MMKTIDQSSIRKQNVRRILDLLSNAPEMTRNALTGCRRIAFYGAPMSMEISKNRYNGYRDALYKARSST